MHGLAVATLRRVRSRRVELVTTDYVLAEAADSALLRFARSDPTFEGCTT